jgi:y4mF family transcriptional regulator
MLVGKPFDFALVVRGRRRQLKLRQVELAKAAGVSREWIVALERGKPRLDFSKVLTTLATLNIELSIYWCTDPPAWSIPLTAAAADRQRRLANRRPRRRPKVPRPEPKPPAGWGRGE